MQSIYLIQITFMVIVILCNKIKAQQTQVSPKLDFSETDKGNATVPDIKQGRTDRNNEQGQDSDGSNKVGGKSGPKIHGVRVTVDTGDGQQSKESKESVEITDLGENKKRVGIHTDITFEITAGGEARGKKTSQEMDDDEEKEDASVPIFKGSGGSGTNKNRNSHDPKSQWNPNFSSEHRGADHSNRGRYPDYPEYYPSNVPVYLGTSEGRSDGSSVFRQSDGWTSYVPRSSYWTTERSYRPNDVSGYRSTPSWKPCYCITNDNNYRRRREYTPSHKQNQHEHRDVVRATSSLIEIIDGKLEKARK